MLAAVLNAPGLLELGDLPEPLCPEGGALLEIKACAVCGTDIKMREQGHRDLAFPRVLGHEMVGRIIEMSGISRRGDGCLAESGLCEGDQVLIYGDGPIGALHALLAELHGAEKIIVAERLNGRIRLLERHTRATIVNPTEESLESVLAAETGVTSVDVILTATPRVRVDSDLLKLLSPGGRICIFSGPAPGNYQEPINLCSIHYHELTITGAYGCSSRHNRSAVELLTSGKIKADWLITKRTSLAGIEDAFSHSSQRSGLKSVVCMS